MKTLPVALGAGALLAAEAHAQPLDADACVRTALRDSGQVAEADAKVAEWQARLAEVQSVYAPKLQALTWLAPMFQVRGEATAPDVERDFTRWGPYFHGEATLFQPLSTFGRAEAGERAARDRTRVEAAAARKVRLQLAFEVRRLYWLGAYARSMLPVLDSGRKVLAEALDKARALYAAGTGQVTQVDLQKLAYGLAEIERYQIAAEMGAALARDALVHTLGLPADATISFADATLPPATSDLPPLADLLALACRHRPEWAQLSHGKAAALSLEQAERLANRPILFWGANLRLDRTPMRPDFRNPYVHDPYNDASAGVAVGLRFDLDPRKTTARGDAAAALGQQVQALERFAATGIPLEVRKARYEAVQARKTLEVSERGAAAARKWMTFAGAAYATGTGEAREVLEGVVAFLQARRNTLAALQDLHIADAAVLLATGRTGLEGPLSEARTGTKGRDTPEGGGEER